MTRQSTIGFLVGVFFTAAVYGTFVKPTVVFESPPQSRMAAAEPLQALPKLNAADEGLLTRLTPHFERLAANAVSRHSESLADELNHYDGDGKKFGGDQRGAVGEGALAAAIGALVKRMIVALITAMIIGILLKVFWAKIGWFLAFYIGGILLPAFVTALVTAKVAAGNAVNRAMAGMNLRK